MKQRETTLTRLLRRASNTAQSGKIRKADALLKQAVVLYLQLPDNGRKDHRKELVFSCNNVAVEALGREHFEEALNSSLAGWECADIKDDDFLYFQLATVLGGAYLALGNLIALEDVVRRCLDSARREFGEHDLRVLDLSMDLLAAVQWQGRTLEAGLLRESIDLAIKLRPVTKEVAMLQKRLDKIVATTSPESFIRRKS